MNRADLEQLIAWKQRRFTESRQTDLFAAAWPRALVDTLVSEELEGVRAGLFTLHAGDRLAAAHLHLISAGVVHGDELVVPVLAAGPERGQGALIPRRPESRVLTRSERSGLGHATVLLGESRLGLD